MFSLKAADAQNQKSAHPDMIVELMCMGQSNMDMDELNKFLNDCNTPEDHEGMGKFLLCLWRGKGIMKEDGSINSDKLKEYLQKRLNDIDPEEVNHVTAAEIVEKCCVVKGNTPRQTAIRLNNCIIRTCQKF